MARDDLRAEFVEEACRALYAAYDERHAQASVITAPTLSTWDAIGPTERMVAREAMGDLLDWLDSRRL